ncbi:MAG TPA: type II secretion system protein [Vicinamibacterales bacterium]|jgi:type II secretory pathway pseudopilin PulG
MKTPGQARIGERGYAMAALLVMLAIMAVAMTVAMPTWRQLVRREKEAELVFRGEQYKRSIALYQRKYAGAYPPDVDTLLKQKFLRKKYGDPMVETGEFRFVRFGEPPPGSQQARPGGGQGTQPGGQRGALGGGQSGDAGRQPTTSFDAQSRDQGRPGVGPRGGIVGVASTSTEASIRTYNGHTHYNEWDFTYTPNRFGPGQIRPGGPRGQPGQGVPPGGGFQPGIGIGGGLSGPGSGPRGGSGDAPQPPPRPRKPGG